LLQKTSGNFSVPQHPLYPIHLLSPTHPSHSPRDSINTTHTALSIIVIPPRARARLVTSERGSIKAKNKWGISNANNLCNAAQIRLPPPWIFVS
jgi:hypothetical protein